MRESIEKMQERARKIYAILAKRYPDARCTLDFKNAWQLVVATILAAQCTDERVNMVTPALFKKYPDAKALSAADEKELQQMIMSTGFFRNKAKSLLGMSKKLIEEFGGKVPDEMDKLTSLRGVGRKTANVILGNCFGKPAIIVDTHCMRVSQRLAFTANKNPEKIEADIGKIIPEERQTMWSHLMVFHGRNICKAPKPLCRECPIISLCPFPEKTK
jgi:endonuclease-3